MSWPLIEMLEELVEQNELYTNTNMEENTNQSLYDYLGKPAGSLLGIQVFKYAKKNKVKVTSEYVSQGGYVGNIMCYPPSFLHDYFITRNNWKETIEKWGLLKQYFE